VTIANAMAIRPAKRIFILANSFPVKKELCIQEILAEIVPIS